MPKSKSGRPVMPEGALIPEWWQGVVSARSRAAHRKVLDAAAELVAERGIDATSMDAIAAHSGVSKATIYKHWPDKEALMLAVMSDLHGLEERPRFDSGDTRADLAAVLCYKPPDRTGLRDRLTPHLAAYSARNPEFGRAWREIVMNPPRRELREILARGIQKKELMEDTDIELALALLLGPMTYSYIFLKRFEEDKTKLAEQVVGAFWRAYGFSREPRKSPKPTRSLHR